MDNYYRECIDKITALIRNKNYTEAKQMLDVELAMPYIPQTYLEEFENLLHLLPKTSNVSSKFFEDFEEIDDAFSLDDEQKLKAILSLERMNIRPYLEVIKTYLKDELMDDWLKQQLLIILLDQGINGQFEIHFENKDSLIDLSKLEHPFKSKHYNKVYQDLVDDLEHQDPSMLQLCLQELNYQLGILFPFKHETVNAQSIKKKVYDYLHAEGSI